MHKYFPELAGKQIRNCRKNLGMSQDDLAEKTNLSKTFVSHIENGKNASITSLIDIVNALGVTLDDIFYDSLEHCKSTIIVKLDDLYKDCTATELNHLYNTNKALLESLRNKNIGDE